MRTKRTDWGGLSGRPWRCRPLVQQHYSNELAALYLYYALALPPSLPVRSRGMPPPAAAGVFRTPASSSTLNAEWQMFLIDILEQQTAVVMILHCF